MLLTPALAAAEPGRDAQPVEPLITRIRMATLSVPDVPTVAGWYGKWLGYRVVEKGRVPRGLAASWGAPAVAGSRLVLLAPEQGGDVFLRIVEAVPGPSGRPATTFGWGSLEFVVRDIDALHRRLQSGGVDVFRSPASLGAPFETIFAMQARGPLGQTLNFSVDKGDPARSNLPLARSPVDRIFLVGLSGPDVGALQAWYASRFRMRTFASYDQPIPALATALGLPESQVFPMTLVRAARKGNTVELHGLPPPAGPRERPAGGLPPGVAIVSFGVASLDAVGGTFVAPAAVQGGRAYGARRSAALEGPAGELIELIEE